MIENYEFYLPKIDEPCVFSNKVDLVNPNWINWGIQAFLGLNIAKGSKNFNDIQHFLDEEVVKVSDDSFVRKMNPKHFATTIGHRTLSRMGLVVQHKIKGDLSLGLPPDLFEEPKSIVTADNVISLRWVLHTANMDGMTPEEAYTYALGLIKG